MNIIGIKIQNFKSVKNLEIGNLKPIVGIWGKNGTGKSSIIQSLIVLRNVTEQEKINLHPILNSNGIFLGTIEDIIYSHDTKNTINIEATFSTGKTNILKMGFESDLRIGEREIINKFRYFPPWRRIATKTSAVSQRIAGNLARNANNIHSYIHWFYYEKQREKLRTGIENEMDKVNMWARKLGYGNISDSLIADNQVMGVYQDPDLEIEVPIINGGYGGNTFLPILFEGYSFTDGILLIEEPEMSLHPAAQSDILDFFLEMVSERNHQIIFTSHSEYLLRKIVRYFKEQKIDKDMVDVLYTWKDNDGTHVERKDLEKLAEKFEERKEILPELTARS